MKEGPKGLFSKGLGLLDTVLTNKATARIAALLPGPVKILHVLKRSYQENDLGSDLDTIMEDLVEKTRLLGEYIQAVRTREYRHAEPIRIAFVIGALAYFVSPLDIIPDAIPIIGFLDDILIMTWLLRLLNDELKEYELWKATQESRARI